MVRVSKETRRLIQAAAEILAAHHPMTVRQVYYQLVANQVIRNNRSQYQAVSKVLVRARRWGGIPWHWIEDRLRRPRTVPCWQDLAAFSVTVENAYSRDVWSAQPMYLEVWLEKDALSGIFEDTLAPYGITLNVGRGYDGWDSIHNAALRYGASGKPVTVLYFGDLDPSGEDMVRSLRQRLVELDCRPMIIKCALTLEDVVLYSLPPVSPKLPIAGGRRSSPSTGMLRWNWTHCPPMYSGIGSLAKSKPGWTCQLSVLCGRSNSKNVIVWLSRWRR